MWRLRSRLFWALSWHMVGCAACRFNRGACRLGTAMMLDLYSSVSTRSGHGASAS